MRRSGLGIWFALLLAGNAWGAVATQAAEKPARSHENFYIAHYQARLEKLEKLLPRARNPKQHARLQATIARIRQRIERRSQALGARALRQGSKQEAQP